MLKLKQNGLDAVWVNITYPLKKIKKSLLATEADEDGCEFDPFGENIYTVFRSYSKNG